MDAFPSAIALPVGGGLESELKLRALANGQQVCNCLQKARGCFPDNARSIFYLAQSYRDTGNLPQALEGYEKGASIGGWDEEVWYSLYQIARLQQRLGFAWALVLDAYLRAYEFRPTRVEPIYQIARFYREHGQYHLGYLFSRAAIDTPYPEDLLFIEKSIYRHELALEYALCREQLGKCASAAGILPAESDNA